MPMFIQGLGGMNRRMYDGGMQYAHNAGLLKWNVVIGFAAWGLGLFQLPFIINFFSSIKWGAVVDRNPWEATTLEWSAPSPPRTRQLPHRARCLPRPVRVQRARRRQRLHAAIRTERRLTGGNPVHRRTAARFRPCQRQAGHLAVPRVGSHALRRAVFHLHPSARRRGGMAPRRAEHQAGRHQHRHPHLLVGDDGDVVGVAEAEQLQQGPPVPADHDCPGRGLPREQVLRVRGSLRARRRTLAQHVPRHLLHADGSARAAHHRRHRRDGCTCWARARGSGRRTRSSSRTASSTRASTGTSSTSCGSSCFPCCICSKERFECIPIRKPSRKASAAT